MASFVRCPSCSFVIGMYMRYVNLAKQAINEEAIYGEKSKYSEYDPEKISFNPDITPSMEKLFDALNIKKRCCRMHLLTVTEFDTYYK